MHQFPRAKQVPCQKHSLSQSALAVMSIATVIMIAPAAHVRAQTPGPAQRTYLPLTTRDGAPTTPPTATPASGTPRPGTPTPSTTITPSPTAPAGTPQPTATSTPSAGSQTITYTRGNAEIINPERGFFWPVDLFSNDSYAVARTSHGASLVRSYARLDAYRAQDLPQSLLDTFDTRMAAARAAGVKVVLRFSYNFGPYPNSEPDASLAQVKRHVAQLQPHLRKNADVIAWMEAGFVGAWGEWHTSTNGLDTNMDAKRDIATALLGALPITRSIQLRYPSDIRALYGATFGASDGFSGSDKSRIGHHNDCFVSSANDVGTYGRDGSTTAQDKALVAAYGAYTPVGGETCALSAPRSNCPTALAELEAHGWTEINLDYEPDVIQSWRDGGCFATIRDRLGYRLSLDSATLPITLTRGTNAPLTVRIANTGFARPMNARPAFVVLDGPVRRALPLQIDPRAWSAGVTHTITTQIAVPADLPAGDYALLLWLPDESPGLRADPRFSIQLANTGTWNATIGANVLTPSIPVR
jgi:hypothetical protein